MTPTQELYVAIRDEVQSIQEIEYVDINRSQFVPEKESYPQYLTSCLIKIVSIDWQTMVEQLQEGSATIELTLYTRDGFAAQQSDTEDADDGLAEVKLIDEIAEKIQFLHVPSFQPLQQIKEEAQETEIDGLTAYKLTFSAQIYRKTAGRYLKTPNPLKQP